jgi:DNA-binding CsgD family transcriptional regulator
LRQQGKAKLTGQEIAVNLTFPERSGAGRTVSMSEIILRAIDALSAEPDREKRWAIAEQFVLRIGGSAINMVSANGYSGALNWARCSMREDWLETYFDEEFYGVDSLLETLKDDVPFQILQGGVLRPQDVANKRSLDYNHGLKDFGYQTLFAFQFNNETVHDKRMIVLAGDEAGRDFLPDLSSRDLRRLCAVFNTFLSGPDQAPPLYDPVLKANRLSAREKDVLVLLARGYRNDIIADRLGIAEITVRKHVSSARRKLGAATREQALVLAVALGHITP